MTFTIEQATEDCKLLVYKLANNYKSVCDFEDLTQAGMVGLKKAFDRYDSSKGAKFSTYAMKDILGEMKNCISKDRSIKVNDQLRKIFKEAQRSREFLTQKNGYNPSWLELSEFMGVPESILFDSYEACSFPESLDFKSDENCSQYEQIEMVSESILNIDEEIMLKQACELLEEPSRSIMNVRLNGCSQQEAADLVNISQVQASRFEKKAIQRMRAYVTKDVA